MKKWLEKMRNKSEVEKRTFAFWTASLITGFIFLIWAFTFWGTISNLNSDENASIKKQASVFESLMEQLKSFSTEVYEAE